MGPHTHHLQHARSLLHKIQHPFVVCCLLVYRFLRVLRFPPRYSWNIAESGVKHHNRISSLSKFKIYTWGVWIIIIYFSFTIQCFNRYVREWLGSMSAAKFVTITPDDKYFIPEACKPHIENSFLASGLLIIFANTSAVLECFQKDGPKGDRYVILKICLQTCGILEVYQYRVRVTSYLRFVYKRGGSSRFTNIGWGYGYGV